jgi:hypothetical protein
MRMVTTNIPETGETSVFAATAIGKTVCPSVFALSN